MPSLPAAPEAEVAVKVEVETVADEEKAAVEAEDRRPDVPNTESLFQVLIVFCYSVLTISVL